MTRDELLSRISIDPQVCFGKPCIRGRRIWVSLVLDLLSGGMKQEEIMKEYDLQEADVLACIAYGAEMSRMVTAQHRTRYRYMTESLVFNFCRVKIC
ncbi:MAG: DUF433 domain-containing protein [Desulfobacteraceae bacterium]|nr:MAG: DUF433 domain-containing protein [Desulfobacteraceae bacterium]